MKKRVLVIAAFCLLLLLSACGKSDLQDLTESNNTWYMYQDEGSSDVVSLKFTKDNRVSVRDVNNIGGSIGVRRLDSDNKNPIYKIARDKKTLSIATKDSPLNFKILKSYSENIYGKHMVGYQIQSGGETYKLAYISKNEKKTSSDDTTEEKKDSGQKINVDDMANHLINVNKGAKAIKDERLIGKFDFSTLIDLHRSLANLEIKSNGTYQMTITEHAPQEKTEEKDNPYIVSTVVENGQVKSLYGKYYLVPMNQLTISYYFRGQNVDRLLPSGMNLKTNSKKANQINRSKTRVEITDDGLNLFADDFEPITSSDNNAIQLVSSDTEQVQIADAITQTSDYYKDYKANSLTSNADLMQLVGAIAENNNKKIGSYGVNFGDQFGSDLAPDEYIGTGKDGSQQPTMQYVFMVSPSQDGQKSAAISTNLGNFLIFGELENKLFILNQPDKDLTTVTWKQVNDVKLKVPALKSTIG
ncbi:hypothetical protein [Lactobacillus terrae]|uniref:hypothetical protein n=1 Tax=Lactobacillus terrae TaxID=2269374 RepID=UPI000C1B6576|nr:hypothetical protein [Lactobacillus terrae]